MKGLMLGSLLALTAAGQPVQPAPASPEQIQEVAAILNAEKAAVEQRALQNYLALEAMTARAQAAEKERDALKAKYEPAKTDAPNPTETPK